MVVGEVTGHQLRIVVAGWWISVDAVVTGDVSPAVVLAGSEDTRQEPLDRVDHDSKQTLSATRVRKGERGGKCADQKDPEQARKSNRQSFRLPVIGGGLDVSKHHYGPQVWQTVYDDHDRVHHNETDKGAHPQEVQAPGPLTATEQPRVPRETPGNRG